jgi:hypothetical protein
MDGKVTLHAGQRERLLEWYRRSNDPQVRLRAHIILLLSQGHTWALIAGAITEFCG